MTSTIDGSKGQGERAYVCESYEEVMEVAGDGNVGMNFLQGLKILSLSPGVASLLSISLPSPHNVAHLPAHHAFSSVLCEQLKNKSQTKSQS